jgi:hypothetical protein
MSPRALLAAVLGVGVIACEAIVGIKDKSVGGEVSDAGPDANADAGQVDACAAGAVTLDAGDPNDPSVPCALQPANLFCADFDRPNAPVNDGWSWIDTAHNPGGSIALDGCDSTSPPSSAKVVVTQQTSGYIQLGWNQTASLTTSIRLSIDLRVDLDAWDGIAETGVSQFYGDGVGMQANYILGPGPVARTTVDVGTTHYEIDLHGTRPPLKAWTRIAIEYDVNAGFKVYEGGQVIGSDATIKPGAPGPGRAIVCGAYVNGSASATQAMTIEIDNVVVRGR